MRRPLRDDGDEPASAEMSLRSAGGGADPGRKPDRRSGRGASCPICGAPTQAALQPFCSQRCADVDLGRWLGERYAIPGPAHDGEPDETG